MNFDLVHDLIAHLRTLPSTGQKKRYDVTNQKKNDQAILSSIVEQIAQIDNYASLLNQLDTSVSSLQRGISQVVVAQESYNESIVNIVKEITVFDQIEKSIAKTLGITTKKSIELSNSYDDYIKKLSTSRAELDKYRTSLNKILPLQSANIAKSKEYSDRLLETQQILQDYQGLTADQAAMYTLYTEGAGKNIALQLSATKTLATEWETTTGQVGAFNTILTEVSNLTADIRSEYSRIPSNLELAVLKSKALGMSMMELDSIGTHLLDIEQSVGKEIEFQLISGRRLVDAQGRSLTNRFREAKLMGDGVEMAQAMNDLVEQYGDLIEKGSYYEKKAMADTLGMEVHSLVLVKQRVELNKKLAESNKQTIDQFNQLTGEQQAKIQLEYETALKKDGRDVATEQLKALQDLKKKEFDLKTPADRTAILLQSIVDNGIKIQRGAVGAKQLEAAFSPEQLQKFMETSNVMGITLNKQNAAFLRTIGSMQNTVSVIDALTTSVGKLVALYPPLQALTNMAIEAYRSVSRNSNLLNLKHTPGKGGQQIKDGIIRFHPSDKFMRVNDSTMIAGTSIDGNKKLATAMSGGGMDMGKLVQAIQTAFAGVKVTVNVDPMQIDREIKFRTATINV